MSQMEKSALPTTTNSPHPSPPGIPEGLVVGRARQEGRLRLRQGVQIIFLLLCCLAVAHIGMKTIADHFGHRPHHNHHHYHHHFDEAQGGFHRPPFHKGPPEPLACYPLAPAEMVNVTLHLRPGLAGPPGGPGVRPYNEHAHKTSFWSLTSFMSKKPAGPRPPPPGPPHIYLHPSLFSSDVSLIREGDADKGHLGKAPGGPEGITVYAIFSREATSTMLDQAKAKKVDICTHRAPNGALVGAFFPPPNGSSPDIRAVVAGQDKEKKQKRHHHHAPAFPHHPKDQFPDISAKFYVPSGLGLHLDSLPPPPPHHKDQHEHKGHDNEDEEDRRD